MFIFIQETCNRLINALDDVADKNETFEVREILGKFSMDTIASCAFGVDAHGGELGLQGSRPAEALKLWIGLRQLGEKGIQVNRV